MSILQDLMHKHTSFAVLALVLLTAIVTVTLYTVNAANAQNTVTGRNVPPPLHNFTGEVNTPTTTGPHNATFNGNPTISLNYTAPPGEVSCLNNYKENRTEC